MEPSKTPHSEAALPDHFETVAQDMLDYAAHDSGVWMDLGSGNGGLGIQIATQLSRIVMCFVDPDEGALEEALLRARQRDIAQRAVAVVGTAEALPLPKDSVDVVVSRGSIFFWKDRSLGLREVYRVLRPGGKAMIGGGLGARYPRWARQEFIRRQRNSQQRASAEEKEAFALARQPETFRQLAREAGLTCFEVTGEGGLSPDDPDTGVGIWLLFGKEKTSDR